MAKMIVDIYGNKCPTLYTLSLISGKWKIPILWKISEQKVVRFHKLKEELNGITNIVLTKCLKEFEAEHIINRVQYEEIPPKVEYSLTEDGEELVRLLDGLHKFGSDILLKYEEDEAFCKNRTHSI